ncbi:nuclear transport factor 2 family protein [Maritalea mediterranea]|uniref:Nuclear transport factor 2 family protein n=1 Tax=Maritalea mediterranea TaxID=2909667 RepID=A0ABS9E779_9HYPH|nr:nuclear transport factor 2 family protein [Maritalea mediterranea]MCF4098734.1 nuclear transport factor 2 family protein [Maritalea mediterranea]
MEAAEELDAADMLWAREQEVLAQRAQAAEVFAADFVSFTPDGRTLTKEQFAAQLRSGSLAADRARLLWREQGQKDSCCLAFRVPEADGRLTTHLSLWRFTDRQWRKQFHIFVEGEDSF